MAKVLFMNIWGGVSIALLMLCAACSEKTEKASISIQLFEAQLAADAKGAYYAGWDTVSFAPSGAPIAYVVSPEPLLTEWNMSAFNASQPQQDDTRLITARLNAYAERKMRSFCEVEANLKRPLGLKVGERWVSFLPLLSPVSDRITLRGFTSAEVDLLQRYMDER